MSDFAVLIDIAEAFQERFENLVWCFLASYNLRVVVAVIDTFKILFSDKAGTIFVELFECLVDDFLSLGVETSSNADKKFFKVDGAILVSIQNFMKGFCFLVGQRASRIIETLKKFLPTHFLVAIIVVNFKGAAETSDRSCTPSCQLSFNLL